MTVWICNCHALEKWCLLRIIVLWRFGGTYLDSDIISVKPVLSEHQGGADLVIQLQGGRISGLSWLWFLRSTILCSCPTNSTPSESGMTNMKVNPTQVHHPQGHPVVFKFIVQKVDEDNLLLTSNLKLRFSVRSKYCKRILNLMTTNSVPRPDVPPCIYKSICFLCQKYSFQTNRTSSFATATSWLWATPFWASGGSTPSSTWLWASRPKTLSRTCGGIWDRQGWPRSFF